MDVLIVAGEASADTHGSAVLRLLKSHYPDWSFFGIGGKKLRAAGLEAVVDASDVSVLGFTGLWGRIGQLIRTYRQFMRVLENRKPNVAILIDLPGFNLYLARRLKRRGVKIIYYCSPQLWAWRKSRINIVRRYVDRMLVLFPFEFDYYKAHGIDAKFVGHPLLDAIAPRESYRSSSEILEMPVIALLPGSRKGELLAHHDLYRQIVSNVRAKYPKARFRLPIANTLSKDYVDNLYGGMGIELAEEGAGLILATSDVALVASGTATLEAGLVGTPYCLVYKAGFISYIAFHILVRWKGFFGIPNLILNRPVVAEFFQYRASAENVTNEVLKMLEDAEYRNQMINGFHECRRKLGTTGATIRAAVEIEEAILGAGSLQAPTLAPA